VRAGSCETTGSVGAFTRPREVLTGVSGVDVRGVSVGGDGLGITVGVGAEGRSAPDADAGVVSGVGVRGMSVGEAGPGVTVGVCAVAGAFSGVVMGVGVRGASAGEDGEGEDGEGVTVGAGAAGGVADTGGAP